MGLRRRLKVRALVGEIHLRCAVWLEAMVWRGMGLEEGPWHANCLEDDRRLGEDVGKRKRSREMMELLCRRQWKYPCAVRLEMHL
jgi:hypothetical protein